MPTRASFTFAWTFLAIPAVSAALAACSGDDTSATPSPDGGTDATTAHDAATTDDGSTRGPDGNAPDAGTDAGPGVVTVPFDPTGTGAPDAVYWDDARQVLYVTDDTNAIWSWTDAAGLKKLFTLPNTSPDGGAAGKLNGITALPDGTLVVTQFGFGAFGGVLSVSLDGGVRVVPGVPAAGRRIAVTRDPSTGTLFSDSFQKVDAGQAGIVETVDLDAGATPIATGFQKPVGLLVQGATLLVVDQNADKIYALPTGAGALGDGGLADGGAYRVYATLPSPDQLTSGPAGSIFTGQLKPTVDGGSPQMRQIFPDGGVAVFAPDAVFTSIDDAAYDPSNHRLFVVDSNGTTARAIKILPVP